MRSLWCTRKGEAHGFKIELVACVAYHCKKRKGCRAYAGIPLAEVAEANREAREAGYTTAEDLSLFETLRQD